jgi:hypothetical protein
MTARTSGGNTDWVSSLADTAGFAHQRKLWGSAVLLPSSTLISSREASGLSVRAAAILVPFMRSVSPRSTEAEPSPRSTSSYSRGRKVLGLWCWGQLNSMPPEIHGPASPTKAGLITRL